MFLWKKTVLTPLSADASRLQESFQVEVGSFSQRGLVVKTTAALQTGHVLELKLGELTKRATVLWGGDDRYICEFVVPLRFQDTALLRPGTTTGRRLK